MVQKKKKKKNPARKVQGEEGEDVMHTFESKRTLLHSFEIACGPKEWSSTHKLNLTNNYLYVTLPRQAF